MPSLDRFDGVNVSFGCGGIDEAECQWCGCAIPYDGLCDECKEILNEGEDEDA